MLEASDAVIFALATAAVMIVAMLLALPVAWYANWRRMVPERYAASDYLQAVGFYLLVTAACSAGAGIGVLLLAPLTRIGPGVAAIPGVLVLSLAGLLAFARRRRV